MKRPAAVLFDLGNVLVSIHPGAFTRHLGIDPETARTRYKEPIIETVRRYELGLMSTAEYLAELSHLFENRYAPEQLREAMLRVIGDPIPGMEKIVSSVASTTPVALVSNTNELHFSLCKKNLPALRFIPQFFLSYAMKASKPDPRYYQIVLERLGVSPDSIVFIDDLEENVEGARTAEMNGILFGGPEELEPELEKLGLTT